MSIVLIHVLYVWWFALYSSVPLTHWDQNKMAAIFNCIFLTGNVWISNKISLKFVPRDPFNNIPALVQIMAWRRPDDKPLSEAMMVSALGPSELKHAHFLQIPHNKHTP